MTNCLIEDEFDGYPGVSTRKDGSKRLLLFNRIGAEYLQVLFQRRELLRLKAAIALRQHRHCFPGRRRHSERFYISLGARNSGNKESAGSLSEKGPAGNLFHLICSDAREVAL